jgi:carboxypeptidase family protein/Big-like domain-containing protein
MSRVTSPRHLVARPGKDFDMLCSQFARLISVSALCAAVFACTPSTSTTPTTTTTTPTTPSPPYTLSGKVVQAGTSNAIPAATVTLTGAAITPLTTSTDANGAFSFSGLTTSGAYSVQTVASGYVPAATAISIPVAGITVNLVLATTPQPLPVLAVTGQASLSARGQTSQLTATVTNPDGTTSDVTTVAKWSSSNPAVAQVSSSGLVTAFSAGVTVISASLTSNEIGAIGVTVTF